MESFLKHTFIFILVLLLTFFSHSLTIIWNPLPVKVRAEEPRGFVDASELMQQGKELYEAGNFGDAVIIWKKAVKVYRQEQDNQNLALALNNLSLTYQKLGEWKDAESAILKALNILRFFPEKQAYAQGLDTKGHLEYIQGQTQKGLDTWKQAAQIYEKLNDNEGIIINKINQAQALQSLGALHQAKNILDELEKSLKNQKDPALQITALHSLANTYALLGDFNKSKQILHKQLKVYQALGNFEINKEQESRILLSLGNTQRALANQARDQRQARSSNEYKECKIYKTSQGKNKIYNEENLANQALKYYIQAAKIGKDIKDISPLTEIQAEINQLSLYLELNKENEAKNLWNKIQSQNLEQIPPSRTNIYAHINLARSLNCFNSFVEENYNHKRKELLLTAIKQAQQIGDFISESYAVGNLGYLYENRNQFLEAQKQTEKALAIAKAYHASDIAYRWQWQLGRIYKAQGDNQKAVNYYEQAVDTLKSVRQDLLNVNSELQFSFRDSAEPVYRQLVDLLLNENEINRKNAKTLQKAIGVIDSLQLAELENFFRCNLGGLQQVQLEKVVEQKDPKAAIFYPIIVKNGLEVILKLPNQPNPIHYSIPVKQIELERTLKKLRQKLTDQYSGRDEYEPLSAKVYDWLIKPAEEKEYLKTDEINTLVFVLDGYFRNIPIAALWDSKTKQFLINKYAVAITPGLQLLGPKRLQRKQLKALVAGLTTTEESKINIDGIPFKFDPLPNVKIEVETIKNILPNSTLILNEQFTREKLIRKLNSSSYPVIHLATHGNFSSNLEETFILTASDDYININELQDLLKAGKARKPDAIELIVFSACDTAAGDKWATLGMAGVAIKAGASSTMGTLWAVEDKSTSLFIDKFYQKLKSKLDNKQLSKAESLQQAQLNLLKNKNYQHPYFWSPFVIIGNWL